MTQRRAAQGVLCIAVLGRVWLLVLAVFVGACGGKAVTFGHDGDAGGAVEAPLSYDELKARVQAAVDARCAVAIECYGPPSQTGYDCSVFTSVGYVSWGSASDCPGLDDCHRALFVRYTEAFTNLRECQIARLEAHAACLKSCPEIADHCNQQLDATVCSAGDELSAGFSACYEPCR